MSWLGSLFGGGAATPSNRIDGPTARELVAAGAQLVDVRTSAEYRQGHLVGAVNIPVDQLARRMDEVATDRPVVLYCRSGARSSRASRFLHSSGISDLHDLGPISAW